MSADNPWPDAWLGDPKAILSRAGEAGVVEITLRTPEEARGLAYRLHAQLRRDKSCGDPAMEEIAASRAVYKDGLTIRVVDYAHPSNTGRVKVTVGATENGSEA